MKLSASTFSDVPPWFETLTSAAPVPAGEVAVIWVVLTTENVVALFAPNTTVVASVVVKLVPVMITVDAPPFGPVVLDRLVIVGGGKYAKLSAETFPEVVAPVVTVTSTVPVPAGDVAVNLPVVLLYETLVALFAPNLTVDADVKLVPEISITVPPVVGPNEREIPVTATLVVYAKLSAVTSADVEPPVVTIMLTVPVPAGDVAVSLPVVLLYETLVAAFEPNATVEDDEKFVPEISTTVPPLVEPVLGLIAVTEVADVYVKLSAVTF